MHSLIETQRNALLALANRRGVTAVRVFGSMSRGDAGDASDVDLLVTLAPGTSALALGGLLLDIAGVARVPSRCRHRGKPAPALRAQVVTNASPL